MKAIFSPLRAAWLALTPRERSAVTIAAWLLTVAVLWLALLAPAVKVLRSAPEQHRILDQQINHQQGLRQEAQALNAGSRMSFTDAQAALQASVRAQLGAGSQMTVSGDRATVTLKAVSPSTLAQWLMTARTGAQSKPVEAQLAQQNGNWDGTLVMQLPKREGQ